MNRPYRRGRSYESCASRRRSRLPLQARRRNPVLDPSGCCEHIDGEARQPMGSRVVRFVHRFESSLSLQAGKGCVGRPTTIPRRQRCGEPLQSGSAHEGQSDEMRFGADEACRVFPIAVDHFRFRRGPWARWLRFHWLFDVHFDRQRTRFDHDRLSHRRERFGVRRWKKIVEPRDESLLWQEAAHERRFSETG